MLHHAVMRIRDFGIEIWMNRWDAEGYLRIGYANNPTILRDGLARTSAFLATLATGRAGASAGSET